MKPARISGLFLLLSAAARLSAQVDGISVYTAKTHTTGFIENKGQVIDQDNLPNSSVKYILCSPGINIQLRQTGFSYDTYTEQLSASTETPGDSILYGKSKLSHPVKRLYHRVDIELEGCNPAAQIIPHAQSTACSNYFTTGTPRNGITSVHSYKSITYRDIYRHIDLEFLSAGSTGYSPAEYRFILHPGANVNDIRLVYKGADNVRIENNRITVKCSPVNFTEKIPSSFFADNRQPVAVKYISPAENTFSFSLPANFKITSDLVIDPLPCLDWGTYYGSGQSDKINCMTIDGSGNIYIAGNTSSVTNMATAGAYQVTYNSGFEDAFIGKLDPSGATQIWGTYYGGPIGETITGITLDASGNICVTGATESPTNMATPGAYQTTLSGGWDAFVAKFDPTGSTLLWGTYYGGALTTDASAVAIDASGNICITGTTNSTFGIATAGAYQAVYGGGSEDVFAAKFNASGSALLWGTYYGGSQHEYGQALALDQAGNLCIAGMTTSTNAISTPGVFQPVSAGSDDGFVMKLDASGSTLLWGTYYGGSQIDNIYCIALDAAGNICFGGTSVSASGITTPGSFQPVYTGLGTNGDAFVAMLNPSGTTRLWGTYLGGTFGEIVNGVALDAGGNVYVTGPTESPYGMATANAYQSAYGGGGDGFLARLNASGSTESWCTYYGGGGVDIPYVVGLDAFNNVYIAGMTGSPTAIATPGAFETSYNSGQYAFVAKFGCNSLPITATVSQFNVTCNGQCNGSASATISGGQPPYTYSWNTTPVQTSDTITGLCTGTYTCIITDGFLNNDSIVVTITQPDTLAPAFSQSNITCNGANNGSITMTASGGTPGYTYSWNTGATTSLLNNLAPGTYTCIVTDANGCSQAESVTVTQPPSLAVALSSTTQCGDNNGIASALVSGGTATYTYSWSPSGGNSADISGVAAGTYTCTVTDANGCTLTQTVNVNTWPDPAVAIQPGDTTINYGSQVTLNENGNGNFFWQPSGGLSCTSCPDPVASPPQTTTYCVTVTDTNGCSGTTCRTIYINYDCGDIFVPNAFSPNNDGENDQLCIYGTKCITALDFAIFDRWGQKVFETTDPGRCWDGTFKGNPMNSGVFFYYLNATLITGQHVSEKGNISLIR